MVSENLFHFVQCAFEALVHIVVLEVGKATAMDEVAVVGCQLKVAVVELNAILGEEGIIRFDLFALNVWQGVFDGVCGASNLLWGEFLVLYNACISLCLWVGNEGCPLKGVDVLMLPLKTERAVWESTETTGEELVESSSEDDRVAIGTIEEEKVSVFVNGDMIESLYTQLYGDVGVTKDVLEKILVGGGRNCLILIIEIAVTIGQTEGDTLEDAGIDVGWRHAPLFGCIEGIVLVEQEPSILTDKRVMRLQCLYHRNKLTTWVIGKEGFFDACGFIIGIEIIDGLEVERRGCCPAIYLCLTEYAEGSPLVVATHVVEEFLLLCVETVRAITMHEYAILVTVVIHVATDVVSAIEDGDDVTSLGKFTTNDGTC